MKVDLVPSGLAEFFMDLLPSLTKREIIIDVTHSYDELNQIVIPMYDLNIDGDFKGDVATSMEKMLKKNKEIDFSKNAYKTIGKALKAIEDQSEDLIKVLENEFAKEVLKDVMDYRKLNLIKYVEALNFLNDYSRRFILAVVHDEFEGDVAHKITGPVDKATRAWVMDGRNMDSFIKVLEILSMPFKTFMSSLKDLEGHIFEPTEWETIRATNGARLDPHGFGFIPVRWNPIYHIGLAANTWRIAKYERNKEEVAKLSLMILALEEQKSKTIDKEKVDRLAGQIRYHSNRINVLQAKIEDIEDKE